MQKFQRVLNTLLHAYTFCQNLVKTNHKQAFHACMCILFTCDVHVTGCSGTQGSGFRASGFQGWGVH